jgi:hypothetical protein
LSMAEQGLRLLNSLVDGGVTAHESCDRADAFILIKACPNEACVPMLRRCARVDRCEM